MNHREEKKKKGINVAGRKQVDNLKTIQVIKSRHRSLKI